MFEQMTIAAFVSREDCYLSSTIHPLQYKELNWLNGVGLQVAVVSVKNIECASNIVKGYSQWVRLICRYVLYLANYIPHLA